MSANDGGPAFPRIDRIAPPRPRGSARGGSTDGMSLRDWFAGRAMSALIVASTSDPEDRLNVQEMAAAHRWPVVRLMAKGAYEYADAMLAERDGP